MIHYKIITSMKQISTYMTFQYETLEFTILTSYIHLLF